jgi:DNA-directed RNA polymerase beta' subunit
MKDNREIGFDILDNADLNQIEEFAMDSNMLDDETKKRIKSIIDKKCKEANGEIILDENKSVNNINHENTVSHVEIYKERKITKIISAVVSVAAVFGIVAGGAAFIRNNKVKPEDVTKSSSNINSVDSDNYEAAAQDVFKQIFQSNELTELKYDYIDITGDATPELFVSYNITNSIDYYFCS